jgi:hypothetical protein
VISAVGFIVFMFRESARLSIRHSWIYVLALCTVGLSFASPPFLYVRAALLDSGFDRGQI